MVMGSESLLCRRHTVHDSQYGIDIDLQTVGHEQRHAGIFHQFSDVSMGDQAVMDAFAGYVLAEKALDYADAVYYGYLFCGSGICHAFNVCDAVAVADIYAAGVFLCHSRCGGGRFLYSGAQGGVVLLAGIVQESTGLQPLQFELTRAQYESFEPMQFANDDIVIELERGRGNIHKSASECEFALTSYNESPSVARLDAVNAPGNALLVKVFLKHKLSGSEQRQLALVHSGSKSFGLSYADHLVFTAENQHMPQLAIITPAGIADDVSPAVFKVQSGNFILAWSVALGAVALLYLLLPVYHAFALPAEERYSGRINSAKEFYREFGSAFVTFFTKKGIFSALLFFLLFSFAEAQ